MILLKDLKVGTTLKDKVVGRTMAVVTAITDDYVEIYFTTQERRIKVSGGLQKGLYLGLFLDDYRIGKDVWSKEQLHSLPSDKLNYKRDFIGMRE